MSMHAPALPQVVRVSRPAWRRTLENALDRILAWRQRRRELEELRTMAELDHRTLRDIGWPADMRRQPPDPALRNERW